MIRQPLTESLLLAAIGGVSATLLARVLSREIVALLDTDGGSIALPLGVNWLALAFTTGLSLVTCVLFGLAPAMKATSLSDTLRQVTASAASSARESA